MGFSLIELLIGVAILGLLMSFAAPNLRAWILNAQIRNAAESIVSGLQQARAEALARNTPVTFTLLPEVGSDRTSWTVNDLALAPPDDQIASRSSKEGSDSVKRTVVPAGAFNITFDSAGMPNPPGPGRISLINLDSTVLPAAESNDLNIVIDFSGAVRMCDPNVSAPPRAC